MRDMYEVLDRWGAWAAADNSGVDWQPIAAGFKGLLPHGKKSRLQCEGNDSNLLIVFYVQIMPDDFVMQLHRF